MILGGTLALSAVLGSPADAGEPLPWYLALGESSMQLRARVPVLRQVVLVPDLATLVDEVARWSPQGHWPVLIEDDQLAAMFIRRFKPQAVYRRGPVGGGEPSAARMSAAAAAAWGDEGGASPRVAAAAAGLPVPSGLVISSPHDPAVGAAVLLAAGRGQDIAWVREKAGGSTGTLERGRAASLRAAIEHAASATGLRWDALGDDIDTLTVCRKLSGKAKTNLNTAITGEHLVAITDLLGRSADGRRWAVTGWIFGRAERAAWMANCSLFLPRLNVWLCDTYPPDDPWSKWSLSPAARILEQASYRVDLSSGTTLTAIENAYPTGLDADLAMMNSKGNPDFFRMAGDADGDPGDLPVLNRPAALSMVHSWSLAAPGNPATVGGRWLERGVYAYVGSVAEPQLSAFVMPELMAQRVAGGVPFLVAARWWPDAGNPMSSVWRINTIGDPLMVAPPPRGSMRRLVDSAPLKDGEVNVRDAAAAAMRQVETAPTDQGFAQALHEVCLLGLDPMAVKLWEAAVQKGVAGPEAAAAAFGALFRQGARDHLLEAWSRLTDPSTLQGDMVWAAFGPGLGAGSSDVVLDALSQALSPGAVITRAERLAPLLAARYGTSTAMAFLQRAQSMATTQRQRRLLSKLGQRLMG